MKRAIALASTLAISGAVFASTDVGLTPNYIGDNRAPETLPSEDAYFDSLLKGDASDAVDGGLGKEGSIRLEGIREAAITLGAQGAARYEALSFNRYLTTYEAHLDAIFNFAPLMIEDDGGRLVQPAVVSEQREFARVADGGQTMRLAAHNYRIEQPARFVLRPPTWRDYLYFTAPRPESIDGRISPSTSTEKSEFERYLRIGYQAGKEQARLEINNRLSALSRDYVGIVRYHMLLTKGYLSKAEVHKDFYPVTGGGEQMTIEDVVLTIKTPAVMDANLKNWRPIPQLPDFDYLGHPFKQDTAWGPLP